MNTDQFWNLIENARNGGSDCTGIAECLKVSLEALPADQILGFQEQLSQRLDESYRWDLWAVAYIVNGGCSDDGFHYFCGWLISQGRQYFEAALRDPSRAADCAESDDCECEDILYVAAATYEAKTGHGLPASPFQPKEPAGVPWEEDALEELYPDLWKRFT
jgi:hypothetical protein